MLQSEGFEIEGDSLKFSPESKNFINTKFGKDSKFSPRITKLPNSKVSIYSAYVKFAGKETVEILKAIKGTGDLKISEQDLNNFIERTAIYKTDCVKPE